MRVTLADGVYESVKALIMDHAVAPGDRVPIDALARRLGVSPTPVREALARLESDGLVRKRPLAGYTTTPLLTRTEFEDLFEMRLLMEPATAQRTARHVATGALGNADIGRLRAEADLPEQATRPSGELGACSPPPKPGSGCARQEDPGAEEASGYASFAPFTTRDAQFHNLLAALSGNRMLHEAVVRLHAHLHLHRMNFPTAHYGVSTVEHHRIVDAIAAGDPSAARSAMRAHLISARERHLPFFAQKR